MNQYCLAHVDDGELLRMLSTLVARERSTVALLLAHLAEVEERRLFLPAACSSMFDYCVQELGFSKDAALKRIRASRVVRRFPTLFEAIADGRLSLTGVVVLAPYVSGDNVDELVALAAHRTRAEIEGLLVQRSPGLDLEPSMVGTPSGLCESEACQVALEPVSFCGAKQVATRSASATTPTPMPTQRFPLRLNMDERTRDQLRYAQELLGHRIPTGDASQVIALALEALIAQLEKQKFAATRRPRSSARPATGRTIPAAVKREVWNRDGGQCTFVSEAGRRCSSRKFLEFDHVLEFALGGRATPDGIRLRCRAHNQYTAEQTFGSEFMERKRVTRRAVGGRPVPARDERDPENDVSPWLHVLGFRPHDVKLAAAYCETLTDRSLEDRVRAGLAFLRPSRASRPYASST